MRTHSISLWQVFKVRFFLALIAFFGLLACGALLAGQAPQPQKLWALKPVVRPAVPSGLTSSTNPIDAFIAAEYKKHGLTPVGLADRRVLLRRVYLDLVGIPPTLAEQDAFLQDKSANAYEKVVDKLLASEQHGVRYARRWLDVLRYADADERMIAAPGIHFWRDWVINALNDDMPYDQFVRTQLTGYRSTARTQMSATGYRSRMEPRPEDMFARGFLARGAVIRDGKDGQELSISAVETVSTAFMGLTVGCAKCHDHMYDPISQKDFYAMKALFDPLVLKKVVLATPAEIVANGKASQESQKKRAAVDEQIEELIAPYRKKLYDERVAMLPGDIRPIILKAEKERTAAEQKIADDYFPVLRIDSGNITQIMTAADKAKQKELQKKLNQIPKGGQRALPVFWTVEVDGGKEQEKTYILTSGDPERPEKNHEVLPGWPFAPAKLEFREGRIEAFSDWLTNPENPLFARVAVNRLWQWHFGEGLQKTASDFGKLGGTPVNPQLLDWLASEFVKRKYSMRELNRLMVTSETYKRASEFDPKLVKENIKADPGNDYLWHFRLQRLEAEPIWDAIFASAGNLDLTVGGKSFDIGNDGGKIGNRRGAYIIRGYSTSNDVVPAFLQIFDVDDGRAPCPLRTQTVTAPQALFMMNSNVIDKAAGLFAARLKKQAGTDLNKAVDLAYRTALARPPSAAEMDRSLKYLGNDPARLKGLAWLLFNLDEFVYVR
ncbi:MAG TPA: DUF1549 and DUF1553 domain-containing protein [Gemmataceae bacterium]|nr:DUF1549 and DUF1553 domain-containing protein [Gemmataceae bacterium]